MQFLLNFRVFNTGIVVRKILAATLCLLFYKSTIAQTKTPLTLWYDKPAAVWTEALPVGNGTLGGMVFGRVEEELVQLNEATLWSGGPIHNNVNPESPKYLQPLRDALFKRDYAKANDMAHKMQGLYSESYMPLGDLVIKQNINNKTVSGYYRDLNIQNAVATTTFTIDGIQYKREVFASAPDKVIIIKLTADKPRRLNIDVLTNSQLKYSHDSNNGVLVLKGKAPAHVEPSYYDKKPSIVYEDTSGCRGMRFELQVKATSTDGKINTDSSAIHITAATEIVLYVTAATSFNGYDKCPDKEGKDEHLIASTNLSKALQKTYPVLFKAHEADFHKYFNRVSLTINKEDKTQLPTDERLAVYRNGAADAGLEALYFQYGRYLSISCSRTPHAPANLQGIWNKVLRAP